jgi:hypothetical protein
LAQKNGLAAIVAKRGPIQILNKSAGIAARAVKIAVSALRLSVRFSDSIRTL